ncbi:MAG: NTP transferase domain-containing protein [Cyclobacteriaceae bacterium]|nr:NTP transferase domain-containing protein [Cyclobacteriaceae bacterium]
MTGIVILSRYKSSRLPGKALMNLSGKPVLQLIIERLLQVVTLAQIVVATSDEASDDLIAKFCKDYGVSCYRGSLANVAERFYKAAAEKQWQYAVRINGDNVFVDIKLLAAMLEVAETGKYDFVSNVKERTFPKGMSIEIVSIPFFKSQLPIITSSDAYQEHVTLGLYEQKLGRQYHFFNRTLPEASGLQMALDTPDDFTRTEKIMSRFVQPHWLYNLEEIITIWKKIDHEPL